MPSPPSPSRLPIALLSPLDNNRPSQRRKQSMEKQKPIYSRKLTSDFEKWTARWWCAELLLLPRAGVRLGTSCHDPSRPQFSREATTVQGADLTFTGDSGTRRTGSPVGIVAKESPPLCWEPGHAGRGSFGAQAQEGDACWHHAAGFWALWS